MGQRREKNRQKCTQAGRLGSWGLGAHPGPRVTGSASPLSPPAYRRADSGAWCCAPASSGLEAAAVCPALSFFHPYPSDPQHLWGQPVREDLPLLESHTSLYAITFHYPACFIGPVSSTLTLVPQRSPAGSLPPFPSPAFWLSLPWKARETKCFPASPALSAYQIFLVQRLINVAGKRDRLPTRQGMDVWDEGWNDISSPQS